MNDSELCSDKILQQYAKDIKKFLKEERDKQIERKSNIDKRLETFNAKHKGEDLSTITLTSQEKTLFNDIEKYIKDYEHIV